MREHFKSYSAVMPVIINKKEGKTQILLHRRKDTGYEDGKWDMSGSGYVDEGETAKMAVVREANEDLPSDIMNIRKVVIDNIKRNITYSELIEN